MHSSAGSTSDVLEYVKDDDFKWMKVVYLFWKRQDVLRTNKSCLATYVRQRAGLMVGRKSSVSGGIEQVIIPGVEPKSVEGVSRDTGKIDYSSLPELMESTLHLALGTPVMVLINCPNAGFFNGSRGHVVDMLVDATGTILGITVLVDQGNGKTKECRVDRVRCRCPFAEDDTLSRLPGGFYQFPVQLAFAFTVHKAQGLEFEMVKVGLEGLVPDGRYAAGRNVSGLLYTALSRVKCGAGLMLNVQPGEDQTRSWTTLSDAAALLFVK
jgi:hypothetical protein